MPKMKRHKGLAKRVKITGKGKVRFNKSGAGHLLSHKDASRRRSLRKHVTLDNPAMAARIRRSILV